VAEIPEPALLAAALAIHRAACPLRDDPDHDCARDAAHEEMLIPRARAALEAAAPLLAEAWGLADLQAEREAWLRIGEKARKLQDEFWRDVDARKNPSREIPEVPSA